MKLTWAILLLTMTMVHAESNAQRISINVKNVKFLNFLEIVSKQTNYKFFYSDDLLKKVNPVTINVKDEEIKNVLDNVLSKENIDYKIVSTTISLIERPAPKTSLPNKLQNNISGIIKDKNGQALVGATVSVKGSKVSVTTNNQGEFAISAASDATLIIRYVGYATQEIAISGKNNFSITLLVDDQNIDEVVVSTGYQQIKKESLTGAVSKIKAEDINVASMGTLDKMLQGQVAGVAVETSSAAFGTAPKIRVRGNASISGVQEPLWVLDGVPLEAPLNIAPTELYSGGARNLLASALSGINPEDIEDITILKDATATALYGTRAVNGVIVITSKRGRKNMPLTINYNSSLTLSLKPSVNAFYMLNSEDQTILNQQIFDIYQNELMSFTAERGGAYSKLLYDRNMKYLSDEQFRYGIKSLKEINTNWFDHLYKNSIQQQHSLSASAGGEKADTRVSVSYLTDPGKSLGEKVSRYTVNSVSNFQINDRFKANLILKYSNRDQKNAGIAINPFVYARDAARNMRPFDNNGDFEYYKLGYTDFNIINEIDNNFIQLNSADVSAQTEFSYKITNRLTATGLINIRNVKNEVDEVFTSNSNYAKSFRQMSTIDPNGYLLRIDGKNQKLYADPSKKVGLPSETVLPIGGILDKETSTSNYYTGRFQLAWEILKDNKGKHNLNSLFGTELYANKQNGFFSRVYGYNHVNKTISPSPAAIKRLINGANLGEDEKRNYNGRNLLAGTDSYFTLYNRTTLAYYTTFSYDYLKKYIVDFSFRADGSNITLNRYTPTWTGGLAWNLSKENFYKQWNIDDKLSEVKVRATYGLRGNDGARGPGLISYNSNLIRVYPEFNTNYAQIIEPENASLEFEKEYMFNAGVDFTLFNSADISFNYYNRKNFDLIGVRQVALSSGYEKKTFNWANMKNEGVELSFNIRPINLGSNLQVSSVFNFAYNKNEVLDDLTQSNPTIFAVSRSRGYELKGKPATGLYSFDFAGLDSEGLPQYYNSEGDIVKSFLGSDINYGNIVYQGSRDPLYTGGFTPKIAYKNLIVSASFVFNAGHVVRLSDFYRDGNQRSLFRDDINQNGDFSYRWNAPGHESFTSIPRLITDNDVLKYNELGFFDESIYTAYNNSSIRTVNASFLRFRNLNLQYNLSKWVSKFKIPNMTVSAEASNIALWTSKRLHGQDPDILLDGLNTPPVRSFSFMLNVTF